MKRYNLFLDDFRYPSDAFSYTHDIVFNKLDWEIVRSHNEFISHIEKNFKEGKFPELIAFDHDLDDAHYEHLKGEFPYEGVKEKTGFHSAKWLIDFCIDNNLKLPDFRVHSMNPVGKENIKKLLENFKRHQNS